MIRQGSKDFHFPFVNAPHFNVASFRNALANQVDKKQGCCQKMNTTVKESYKRSLKLVLTPTSSTGWEIWEIVIDGGDPHLFEKLDRRARAFPPLCLLILLTHMHRKRYNKSKFRFSEKYRLFLSTLSEAIRPEPKIWHEEYFGCNPFFTNSAGEVSEEQPDDAYVVKTVKDKKHFTLIIPEQIDIEVVNDANEPLQIHELAALCNRLGAPPNTAAGHYLKVELHPFNGQVISSEELLGLLANGYRFELQIEWSSGRDLAIFWMDSEDEVHLISPFGPKVFFIEQGFGTSDQIGEYSTIKVSSERGLNINTGQGIESCLILERTKKFTQKDVEFARNLLRTSSKIRPRRLRDHKPSYRLVKVIKRRRGVPEGKRFEAAGKPGEWDTALASDLSGLADALHIFDIENY